MGRGKQFKSKFLMLYNVSIEAKSPSTVSNRPISYSVTFWGSYKEIQLHRKWLKIEVLQMIFHNLNLKSILTSRNLAAGCNLTSPPNYKNFKKCASINVTLYGFGIIQGFSAKFFVAKSTILKWFHVRYYIFWWNSPNPLVNCKKNLRNLVF